MHQVGTNSWAYATVLSSARTSMLANKQLEDQLYHDNELTRQSYPERTTPVLHPGVSQAGLI